MKTRSNVLVSILLPLLLLFSHSSRAIETDYFHEMHAADLVNQYVLNPIDALIQLALSRLPNPLALEEKLLVIDLPSGKRIRGVLYSDGTKGKLALVRCGLFCGGNRTSVAKFMASTFREGLGYSHVLVIGNSTAIDYWKDNLSLDLGGYEEALQTDELLVHLGTLVPALHGKVDHITLVGVSLGGHTALTFSLMQSHHLLKSTGVREIISLCPVSDLQKSFFRLFEGDSVSAYVNATLMDQFSEVAPLSPSFQKMSKTYRDLQSDTARRDYLWSVINSSQKSRAYLNYSDITRSVGSTKVPTLILHADDDFVVRPADNTARILEDGSDQFLAVELSRYGSHCAFTEVYPEHLFVDGLNNFLTSVR